MTSYPHHVDTRDYDGGGTYAVSVAQARSIIAVRWLMNDGPITNNCSLYSAASLPDCTLGWVRVARWDGKTLVVKKDGSVVTAGQTLYPQHNYLLAEAPPEKTLREHYAAGESVDIIPDFPVIPLADNLI